MFPQYLEEQSLPIFPVQGKKPACRGGLKAATADPAAQLMLWCNAYRPDGVAVRTGAVSGIDVLDVDLGGLEWLAFCRHEFRIPRTRTHRTPRGGYHFLFHHAEGLGCPHALDEFKINIKGDGGYVVWPPSPDRSVFDDAPVKEWPAKLLEIIRTSRQADPVPEPVTLKKEPLTINELINGTAPLRQSGQSTHRTEIQVRTWHLLRVIEHAQVGNRNNAIHWAACRFRELVSKGMITQGVAEELMLSSCRVLFGEPVWEEVRDTIRSGLAPRT